MYRKFLLFITLLITLTSLPVYSYKSPGTPDGFVNDFANTFTPTQESKLESALEEFKRKTGAEIAVVIIRSFEGDTKENFAVKLFDEWNIGDTKDRGVLILISRIEREVRVEVGYGLEGDLPDSFIANSVLNKDVLSFLSQDAYYSGVSNSVNVIFKKLDFNSTIDFIENSTEPSPAIPGMLNEFWIYVILGVLVFALVSIERFIKKKFNIKDNGKNKDSIFGRDNNDNPFRFGGGRSGGGGAGSKF